MATVYVRILTDTSDVTNSHVDALASFPGAARRGRRESAWYTLSHSAPGNNDRTTPLFDNAQSLYTLRRLGTPHLKLKKEQVTSIECTCRVKDVFLCLPSDFWGIDYLLMKEV